MVLILAPKEDQQAFSHTWRIAPAAMIMA